MFEFVINYTKISNPKKINDKKAKPLKVREQKSSRLHKNLVGITKI